MIIRQLVVATVNTKLSTNYSIMSALQVPLMPRGMLPMFDVVCSRKASGPWETPCIVAMTAGAAAIGPGCGIPIADCMATVLEVAAAGPIGDPPIAGAVGLLFIIACQC